MMRFARSLISIFLRRLSLNAIAVISLACGENRGHPAAMDFPAGCPSREFRLRHAHRTLRAWEGLDRTGEAFSVSAVPTVEVGRHFTGQDIVPVSRIAAPPLPAAAEMPTVKENRPPNYRPARFRKRGYTDACGQRSSCRGSSLSMDGQGYRISTVEVNLLDRFPFT
jgi:hypothetical protein